MLVASVFTAACPHALLGKIEPDVKKKKDKLLGIYTVKISQYPALEKEWGSVRMLVEGTLGIFPKIVISRVPKADYDVDFICITEQCPHEGFPIGDFNEETYTFVCTGQGTIFAVDGTYIWGPAHRNLSRFELTYDGGDNIYIEIPALIEPDSITDKESLTFSNPCYPNPCSTKTSFEFGIEISTKVEIRVFSSNGIEMKKISYNYLDAGVHKIELDVSKYESGVYFYEIITKFDKLVKQFVVYR